MPDYIRSTLFSTNVLHCEVMPTMLAAKGTLRSQMYTLNVLLIWQMFLKANVDLSGLTNLILTQNIIGSTIKVGMEGGREGGRGKERIERQS